MMILSEVGRSGQGVFCGEKAVYIFVVSIKSVFNSWDIDILLRVVAHLLSNII